jgi:hypothetical protein
MVPDTVFSPLNLQPESLQPIYLEQEKNVSETSETGWKSATRRLKVGVGLEACCDGQLGIE